MILVHSTVRKGSLISQEGQFEITSLIARGGNEIAINGAGANQELYGGFEIDLPSLVDFCKRILIEAGALPKWFYMGVIVDAAHSQIMTYFSPSKDTFFSDIYNDIKGDLAGDLLMADTESVVKNFFENNRDYLFNYKVIPLESFLAGSMGGKDDLSDIRI